MKTHKIRYNTSSTTDSERWRLISEDNIEILVSDIFIDGKVYTTKDYVEGVGGKWHITCKGVCDVRDGVAFINIINTPPKGSAVKRHLLKTISYRFLGTLTTIMTAYFLGVPIVMVSMLGVGELVLKPVAYFLHERFWYKYIRIK